MPKAESEKSTGVYSRMARYYDLFSSKNVDYRALTDYLERVFAKHKNLNKSGSILDVACGTGNYTFMLAKDGYKVTGIDISEDMLHVARSKATSKTNPVFLKMDMRRIRFKDKYDVVAVLFGGFGYLLTRGDVERFLVGARKVLRPDGLLVFEFGQDSAVYPADASRSGNTSWDKVEDGGKSIIRLHLSKYDPQTNKLSFGWDLMVVDDDTKKVVDSFSEVHTVRIYTISQVRELLEGCGFQPLAFYEVDLGSRGNPKSASFSTFRVLAVAKPT